MENRKGARDFWRRPYCRVLSAIFYFASASLVFSFLVAGCAAPADPYERKALVPKAVTDLTAAQSGNDVVLTFTLPEETADQRPLVEPPAIEIYRDFEPPAGAGAQRAVAPTNPTLLVTIPAAIEDRYTERDHIRYVDSLRAEDFATHQGGLAVYMVRTRVSPKKSSADSSAASVLIRPVPDPIDDLKAEVTHSTIVLTWTAPRAALGGPAPLIDSYHVYRAEVEPGAPVAPGATADDLKLRSLIANIGETKTTIYQDEQFEFGKTYVYSVRSVTEYAGEALESAGSKLTMVEARDTFPPESPQGIVVVFVPPQNGAAAHLELSWAISSETDIAGYNVYRSDRDGNPGTRMNTELLLTPAFRDMNVLPGRRYFYTVTAVDRSGNESPSSAVATGDVSTGSQPTP